MNVAEFVAGNRLEVPSLKLLGIIVIISFGVMLTGNFSLSYDDFLFRSVVLGNFQLVWSVFFFSSWSTNHILLPLDGKC
jgi:hypothetical protein